MGRKAVADRESVMAAVKQLREEKQPVNTGSVRAITGGGNNQRVADLIRECTTELEAHDAQILSISPWVAELGAQLFQEAALRITTELDREASERIQVAEEKAIRMISEARSAESLAYATADRAEESRDAALEEIEEWKKAVAVAEGKLGQVLQQLVEEQSRAAVQLGDAERAKTRAQAEAAEIRGEANALRSQVHELNDQLETALTSIAKARSGESLAIATAEHAEEGRHVALKEVQSLNKAVAVADGKLEQLLQQISEERSRAAVQLGDAELARNRAQTEASEIRGENNALRSQVNDLNGSLAAAQTIITELRAKSLKGGAK